MITTITSGSCPHCQRADNRTISWRPDLAAFRMDEPVNAANGWSQNVREFAPGWICKECEYTATHRVAA